MIKENNIVNIGSNFSLVVLDKEYFFLPNSTDGISEEKLFALNPMGYYIASCIDGKKTVGEIIDCVCERTDVDRDTAKADILEFLNMLYIKKLICQ